MSLPFKSDLDEIVRNLAPHWGLLRDQKLLVTGATGIVGKWLLTCLLHADSQLELGLQITALSRRPERFIAECPEIGRDRRLNFICGDVRLLALPAGSRYDLIIHAATDVVDQSGASDVLDTCITGTRAVLAVAREVGARRLLLLSSGAVYGKTPSGYGAIPEDFIGPLDFLSPHAAYAQGKRCAELLCASESCASDLTVVIARCFAMLGPYLPLDKHFAVGNFLRSALDQTPIVVNGDGSPVRSYLYLSDVATQLILLLLRGNGSTAYNVGGAEPVTIAELAKRVNEAAAATQPIEIRNVRQHGAHADIYYPDVSRIHSEFIMAPPIGLSEAIKRTLAWHKSERAAK